MVIGSDEEKAIVKALKSVFPSTNLTLCTRHIEQNVNRYLHHTVGMSDKLCKPITDALFGTEGLVSVNTTTDFEHISSELQNKLDGQAKTYIMDKIIPTLKTYVFDVRNETTIIVNQ